ncbi:hypothetical protein MRB53_019176 [Persea americana]|uniref:Uncharacterized protein n=1 Tax=Persea americana TaxID=3435 RepID=A0ACC2KXB0_PERAE|nr:hypothetical protein MRB53_019176 [Persea americana]
MLTFKRTLYWRLSMKGNKEWVGRKDHITEVVNPSHRKRANENLGEEKMPQSAIGWAWHPSIALRDGVFVPAGSNDLYSPTKEKAANRGAYHSCLCCGGSGVPSAVLRSNSSLLRHRLRASAYRRQGRLADGVEP